MQSTSSPGSTPPRKTANAATMCCPPPGTNTKACPNTWPPPKAAWTATSKKPAASCKTTPTSPNPPPPGPSYDDLRPAHKPPRTEVLGYDKDRSVCPKGHGHKTGLKSRSRRSLDTSGHNHLLL